MSEENYIKELEEELLLFEEEFDEGLREQPFTNARRTFVLKQIIKLQVEISEIQSKERSNA